MAWKARWIAKATLSLSMEAARFVDARVAAFAHRLRVSELDRLVETAIAQFMPEEAERRRKAAADGRSFNVGKSRTGSTGTPTSGALWMWPMPSTSTRPWPRVPRR